MDTVTGIEAMTGEIENFQLVEMKKATNGQYYPHCKLHGAMNKITSGDNGIWRCLAVHSRSKIVVGNSVSYKENDTVCRAVAKQVANSQKQ